MDVLMITEQIHALSSTLSHLSQNTRLEIERAYIDTLAVLCAGWNEDVTVAARKAYPDCQPPWQLTNCTNPDDAAMIWAAAAHALDYDDVHMTSVTHPSAVLIPAIEAASHLGEIDPSRRAGAFALGLAVNVGLGKALGFGHYAHGWHATATIGTVSAATAVAHLLNLNQCEFSSALAIAAAQSAGLQRNFGSMVKPLQAGLAAQTAVRAVRLAQAGVTGPADVFSGSNGFLAIYGKGDDLKFSLDVDEAVAGLSRKLFACCYMAHRPVAAALDFFARRVVPANDMSEITMNIEVAAGCLKALTINIPKTGLEAKFSGQYTVAYALRHGRLGLKAFSDMSVQDQATIELARRVTLTEPSKFDANDVGMDRGEVRATVFHRGETLATTTIIGYPGSPSAPITGSQLSAKLADCIEIGAPDEPELEDRVRVMARSFAGNG